jgi:hypothetical protein
MKTRTGIGLKMQTASSGKRVKSTRRLVAAALFIVLASASSRMVAARTVLDFDGDGKTDYAVTHFSNELIEWFVAQSNGGTIAQQFGMKRYFLRQSEHGRRHSPALGI